jgi:hypothetical protein
MLKPYEGWAMVGKEIIGNVSSSRNGNDGLFRSMVKSFLSLNVENPPAIQGGVISLHGYSSSDPAHKAATQYRRC